MIQGYTFKAEPTESHETGLTCWQAKVRRKTWARGYWVTIASNYVPGPAMFCNRKRAIAAAESWAKQNEGG